MLFAVADLPKAHADRAQYYYLLMLFFACTCIIKDEWRIVAQGVGKLSDWQANQQNYFPHCKCDKIARSNHDSAKITVYKKICCKGIIGQRSVPFKSLKQSPLQGQKINGATEDSSSVTQIAILGCKWVQYKK